VIDIDKLSRVEHILVLRQLARVLATYNDEAATHAVRAYASLAGRMAEPPITLTTSDGRVLRLEQEPR